MKMQKNVGVCLSVAAGLLMASSSLFAHHSEAVFDKEHLVTVKAVITKHELINPHQLIHMKVKDADGNVRPWVVQGTYPGMARSVGWTPGTLKPGDEVTMTLFQYKDGQFGGTWLRIVKADGTDVPVPDLKKRMVAQYLLTHNKELSKEEYEVWKKYTAGFKGVPGAVVTEEKY